MRQFDHIQQPISTLLKKPKNQLAKLIDKVNRLHVVNQCLLEILEPNLAKHCKTANIKDNQLILITDTAAWATRIRYMSPDLVRALREKTKLTEIESLQCIISPKNFISKLTQIDTQSKPSLSTQNAHLLESIAQTINDPKLKKALLKLAKNGK